MFSCFLFFVLDFHIYLEIFLRNKWRYYEAFNRIIILLLFLSTPKAQYDAMSIGLQSLGENILHSAALFVESL